MKLLNVVRSIVINLSLAVLLAVLLFSLIVIWLIYLGGAI